LPLWFGPESSLPNFLISFWFDFNKPVFFLFRFPLIFPFDFIMSIRALSLHRGKGGDTQNFSRSATANPSKITLLQDTLTDGVTTARRSQIWADPTNCSQFACRWRNSFGFFTRPVVSERVSKDGFQWMVGSFTNTIGQVFPVAVPLDDFDGFFTTLVRKADATRFNLPIYPRQPEAIEGPPVEGEKGRGARNACPVADSLERLNWIAVGRDNNDDATVIVVLPQFLPIGPGQTFPHHHPLVSDTTFRDSFPLLEVWRKGIVYARDHNGNNSVTQGGTLFHLASVALAANAPDPTEDFDVRVVLFRSPNQLRPDDPRFSEVAATIGPWSDQVWIELGGQLKPDFPAF